MPPEPEENDQERFDVRVVSTPEATPFGEAFAPALSRVFGVELWMGERIARNAPVFVKRGVSLEVAEHLRTTLERLGARVVIQSEALSRRTTPPSAAAPGEERRLSPMPSLPAALFARPSWPPGLPPDSPHVPRLQSPPRGSPVPSEWRHGSPPPRASARPPAFGSTSSAPAAAPAPSLRPTAPPTARPWTPLPPQPPRSAVGTGTLLLGAATVIAILLAGATHWLRRMGDAELLGNTPNEQTACARNYGLTGPGIDEDRRAKLTLVVAWQTGCLDDDYRSFLQNLADAHRGELSIIGAALASSGGASALPVSKDPPSPPAHWPPRDCEPGFELLPTSQGYVSDSLSAPATYLYDSGGSLIAVWRGGMSLTQRERLTAWIDRRNSW